MGLIQRVFEGSGLVTVSLSMIPEVTERVGVPRAGIVHHPMGAPYGAPGHPEARRQLLLNMLDLAREAQAPGTIRDFGRFF